MAQTPGFRLKVLASGLHQLANKCDKASSDLSADATPPAISTSGWTTSAVTAHVMAERAGKDVSAVAAHFAARAVHFNLEGTAFTQHDQHGAAQLRGVGR